MKHIVNLLNKKGGDAAAELRRRIASGCGIAAKGVEFDPSVLQEALGTWAARSSRLDGANPDSLHRQVV